MTEKMVPPYLEINLKSRRNLRKGIVEGFEEELSTRSAHDNRINTGNVEKNILADMVHPTEEPYPHITEEDFRIRQLEDNKVTKKRKK